MLLSLVYLFVRGLLRLLIPATRSFARRKWSGHFPIIILNAVLPWAVAALISKRYGDEHLADRTRPTLAT